MGSENWDIECVGPRITTRSAHGVISLVLRMATPNRLIVERLEMQVQGFHFRGNQEAGATPPSLLADPQPVQPQPS